MYVHKVGLYHTGTHVRTYIHAHIPDNHSLTHMHSTPYPPIPPHARTIVRPFTRVHARNDWLRPWTVRSSGPRPAAGCGPSDCQALVSLMTAIRTALVFRDLISILSLPAALSGAEQWRNQKQLHCLLFFHI